MAGNNAGHQIRRPAVLHLWSLETQPRYGAEFVHRLSPNLMVDLIMIVPIKMTILWVFHRFGETWIHVLGKPQLAVFFGLLFNYP